MSNKSMTKKMLVELLAEYPDSTAIWMSTDQEGNGYSPMALQLSECQQRIGDAKLTMAIVLWPGYAFDGAILLDENGEPMEGDYGA